MFIDKKVFENLTMMKDVMKGWGETNALNQQMMVSLQKTWDYANKLEKDNAELKSQNDSILLILDDLQEQIAKLIVENEKLTATNERLFETNRRLLEKMHGLNRDDEIGDILVDVSYVNVNEEGEIEDD